MKNFDANMLFLKVNRVRTGLIELFLKNWFVVKSWFVADLVLNIAFPRACWIYSIRKRNLCCHMYIVIITRIVIAKTPTDLVPIY